MINGVDVIKLGVAVFEWAHSHVDTTALDAKGN